ncbi:MAG: GNAT family N-acetyltransferase [Simkaniaceae bacterium]|nr:GNAT family N-acetyltransferase [Simkaniaceae bacterium]
MHFEILRKEHIALVKGWLNQDYVAAYWYGEGLANTLHSIDLFVQGEETIYSLFIAYDKKMPFAFLMTSSVDSEKDILYAKYCKKNTKAITLDLLIGNRSYLGKGLSHSLILNFIKEQYDFVTDVFIDPSMKNLKAIHVYEKAGFQKLEEFIPTWDPKDRCLLMQLIT